ncbi:hypothetical protein VTO73DRAFT_11834 [Trametes versicolor]
MYRSVRKGAILAGIQPFGCGGGDNLTQELAIMSMSTASVFSPDWLTHLALHRECACCSCWEPVLVIRGYFIRKRHNLFFVVTPLQLVSLVAVLTDPLTAVLTCRFLLALQSANQQALRQGSQATGEDDQRGGGSTLQFASRVVGSMAASIPARHEFDEFENEESEEGVPDAGDGQGRALEGGACEDVLDISSQAGQVVEC